MATRASRRIRNRRGQGSSNVSNSEDVTELPPTIQTNATAPAEASVFPLVSPESVQENHQFINVVENEPEPAPALAAPQPIRFGGNIGTRAWNAFNNLIKTYLDDDFPLCQFSQRQPLASKLYKQLSVGEKRNLEDLVARGATKVAFPEFLNFDENGGNRYEKPKDRKSNLLKAIKFILENEPDLQKKWYVVFF